MRRTLLLVALLVLWPVAGVRSQPEQLLDIYFIDVEGGQATLFVSPNRQAMLVDSGGGYDANQQLTPRDPDRIAAVVKAAGLSRIDYLVTTHYHWDHVAGAPRLASLVPIGTYVDHGDPRTNNEMAGIRELFEAYLTVRKTGRYVEASPGARIPLAGVDVEVISSAARLIRSPLSLPGAGTPNPLCSGYVPFQGENLTGENSGSVGIVLRFGAFTMIDTGDLLAGQERDLVCPNNLIGRVDVYLSGSHGVAMSGSRLFVHAIQPRVIVWNGGPAKGSRETFDVMQSAPRTEHVWQLHYLMPHPAMARMGEVLPQGGDANNGPDELIANLDGKGGTARSMNEPVHEGATAHYIKLSARKDGSFTVTNSRTGGSRQYSSAR